MILIAIYVDDLMIFTNSGEMQSTLKTVLMTQFKMKDLGIAKHCIGLHLMRNEKTGAYSINQSTYIKNMLERFGMWSCNPVSTPVDINVKLTKQMCPTDAKDIQDMSQIPYQEAVGCLLYLSQGTRPDIAFAVNNVSRFNANHGKQHWMAVKRIFRYLRGTVNKKLYYAKSSHGLIGYSDADWAGEIENRRSCTGYVFTRGNGAISWNSKLQQTVALSTTEAEYMALSAATQEVLWLRQFEQQFWSLAYPTMIFCDNRSAICLTKNDAYQRRSKHIDIRHHFIRQKCSTNEIKVAYIGTNDMLADGLTKGVTKQKHNFCFDNIGLL